MMDRRTALAGVFSIAQAPSAVLGQTARLPGKIGYVHPVTVDPSHITLAILQQAWRRLGYVDGETVLLRSGDRDPQRIPGLVADLIKQGSGVLIVVGADAVRAAAKSTTTIPIVAIDMETDPVRTGLIASYAQPGGNLTGLFLDLPSLATKWIELLREAVPGLERIALIWQPSTGREQLDMAVAAAQQIGIETVVLEIAPSDSVAAK